MKLNLSSFLNEPMSGYKCPSKSYALSRQRTFVTLHSGAMILFVKSRQGKAWVACTTDSKINPRRELSLFSTANVT